VKTKSRRFPSQVVTNGIDKSGSREGLNVNAEKTELMQYKNIQPVHINTKTRGLKLLKTSNTWDPECTAQKRKLVSENLLF